MIPTEGVPPGVSWRVLSDLQDEYIALARAGSASARWTVWAIEILLYRLSKEPPRPKQ